MSERAATPSKTWSGRLRGHAGARHAKLERDAAGPTEHHGYVCRPENKSLWAGKKEQLALFFQVLLQFYFHIYSLVKWKRYKLVIWSDKGTKTSLLYRDEEKVSLNLLTLCRVAFPHLLPVYRQCPCNKLCLRRTKICICTTYLLITIASSAHWFPSPGINSNTSSLWYLFFKTGLPRMYLLFVLPYVKLPTKLINATAGHTRHSTATLS